MILWIIFAAMTAAALWWLLRPFRQEETFPRARQAQDAAVYRDQLDELERDMARGFISGREAAAARAEIARRLLAAAAEGDGEEKEEKEELSPVHRKAAFKGRRRALWAAVTGLPAVALALYLSLGSPGLPGQPFDARREKPLAEQTMAELAARVEARLRETPEDTQGWAVLARTYVAMGRYDRAVEAYRRLVALKAPDAPVLSAYGDALVRASGGVVTEQARRVFEQAAARDPKSMQARYYLGLAEFQEGDVAAARAIWEPLLKDMPAGAPIAGLIRQQLHDTAQKKPSEGARSPETDSGR